MATQKRLQWGAGTIYKRGATFYYENKQQGLKAKSLRTAEKTEAIAEARRRFGHLEEATEKDQQRKLLNKYREHSVLISLTDAFSEYERRLSIHSKKGRRHVDAGGKVPLAPKTVKIAKGCWERFVDWLADEYPGVGTIDQITPAIAEAYFIDMRSVYKASSYNRYLAALRGIMDGLLIAGGIETNPFRQVKPITRSDVDTETASKRPFTPEELQIIDTKATGWIRPAVLVGFYTGLRLADVICLRWDCVGLDAGFFRVTVRKTSKTDDIYAPEAMQHLREWQAANPPESPYVFPDMAAGYLGIGRKRDEAIGAKRFQKFLTDTCQFTTKNDDGQTVLGFHSLRASNATYLKRHGATRESIQERLQHSNASTTDGYIDETVEERRQKLIEEHIPLDIAGAEKPVNGDLKARIHKLAQSMNGKNWKKTRDKILEVLS